MIPIRRILVTLAILVVTSSWAANPEERDRELRPIAKNAKRLLEQRKFAEAAQQYILLAEKDPSRRALFTYLAAMALDKGLAREAACQQFRRVVAQINTQHPEARTLRQESFSYVEKHCEVELKDPIPSVEPLPQDEQLPPPPPPPPPIVKPAPNPIVKPAPTPVYRKAWFWTVVGVGAAAIGTGIGLGVYFGTSAPQQPGCPGGDPRCWQFGP